jgi:hypothetical protein
MKTYRSRSKVNFIIPNVFLYLIRILYCQVDHFSKYGLSDSDEEDIPISDVKKFKPTVHQQEEKQQKEQQQKTEQQLLAAEVSPVGSNVLYGGGDNHSGVEETMELHVHCCVPNCPYQLNLVNVLTSYF